MNVVSLNNVSLDGNVIRKGASGGGGGVSLMTEVTWQELKDLRDNGQLTAGHKYRMIDYDTYTSQEGTQSAMHPFDLILTALDNKTLSEECSAIQSARDVDGYFANSNLGAWRVWYCLDNNTARFSWAVAKGVIYSSDEGTLVFDYFGDFEWNGATYTAYRIDYGKFVGLDTPVYVYTLYSNDVPNVGDIPTYVLLDGTALGEEGLIDQTAEMGQQFVVSSVSEVNGKGIIYRLVDEYNNDICYDFKNILFISTGSNGGTYSSYTFYSAHGSRLDGSIEGAAFDNSIKYPRYRGLPIITLAHDVVGEVYKKYNIHIINCSECYIYVSEGGNYSNCTFENCSLTNFGSGGGNYGIQMDRCYIKDCSGDLVFDKTKNDFINVEIIGVSNVSALEGRSSGSNSTSLLHIRQKADGTIYSYTDEDVASTTYVDEVIANAITTTLNTPV